MLTINEFYDRYPSIVVDTQKAIHELEATDFERLCQVWSMESFPGAKVSRGPTNKGDQGVDIEVVVGGITPMRIVIQAKCWDPSKANVSIKVVNETAGAAVAKNAGYAIVITSGGFTKEAILQAKRSTNIKMKLLDGKEFLQSLLQLPEYSRRLQAKKMNLLAQTASVSNEFQKSDVSNYDSKTFTNNDNFCFPSKIEQKIGSDRKLHSWLVSNGICCFQDFLFLNQSKYSQLKRFVSTLSTGSKLAVNSFLNGEIEQLRQIYTSRLQNIRKEVKSAQTLQEVFQILGMNEKTRALFLSSDGVGQNFDEKDNPQVLCAIEKCDFEKLLHHIESETCRHELIVIMNVITGKSPEELKGTVLSISAADNFFAKFEVVSKSNGKIKTVLLGPGLFSLPKSLVINSSINIIGSGWGNTIICGKIIVKASACIVG
jgi:hypothetical protein